MTFVPLYIMKCAALLLTPVAWTRRLNYCRRDFTWCTKGHVRRVFPRTPVA